MNITTDQSNAVTIIMVEGKVDTNTSPQLEEQLNQLLGQGVTQILADFEQLSFISSAGLRVLLAAAKKLRAGQGELRVCNLNPTVKEIFDISGFSTILPVFDNREQGLSN